MAKKVGMVGPVPEGVTISNGSMYATMYESPHNTRAHIVVYKFNHDLIAMLCKSCHSFLGQNSRD